MKIEQQKPSSYSFKKLGKQTCNLIFKLHLLKYNVHWAIGPTQAMGRR